MNVITMGQSTTIFLCINPFSGLWQTPFRTTGQLGDPRASLLLISEKAVLCEIEKKGFCPSNGKARTYFMTMMMLRDI